MSVNVTRFGGGGDASVKLRENDIVTNRNLIPVDHKKKVRNPSGVRLGTQEMTHFGMKEPKMEEIARLFQACLADGQDVRPEVRKLRERFPRVEYSFDPAV